MRVGLACSLYGVGLDMKVSGGGGMNGGGMGA